MDSGLAAFLGALAGSITSLSGIFLTDHLKARREILAEEPRKKLLLQMLSGGHNWRTVEALASVAGITEAEAMRLLVAIGARGSETNPKLWGLISRNPLPQHIEPSN